MKMCQDTIENLTRWLLQAAGVLLSAFTCHNANAAARHLFKYKVACENIP